MLFTIPVGAADSDTASYLRDELTDTMLAFCYDAADVATEPLPALSRRPRGSRRGCAPRRVA